jgi:ParB family chromosome partitioning protein
MSKKLAAKASMIQLPPVAAPKEDATAPDAAASRAKTAPGSMVHFMSSQSAAVKEAETLREKLQQFDGARPVRALDPKTVRPSRWANRHADAYADPAFEELKAELASAGGNVQPVCVRAATPHPGQAAPVYELVFGHRRHRACLELGLPLQAMVVEASDRELFETMERENRSRKNLSAWEQGVMYRRALDEGLYPSLRKLADGVGVDVSLVSKSVALARLPEVVVQAFSSPLEIQFRWAQPLSEALQRDPDGVVSRAVQIRRTGGGLPATQVLDVLLGRASPSVLNGSTAAAAPARQVIHGTEGRRATVQRDAQDRVMVRFSAGALSPAAEQELATWIARLIG